MPTLNEERASSLIEDTLKIGGMTQMQHYKHMKKLEVILNEWVELRNLADDLASPLEAPDANK